MIQYPDSSLLFDAKAVLAEGPSYLPGSDEILWVDIEVGKIGRFDLATQTNRYLELGGKVGFVSSTTQGDYIAGTEKGIERIHPQSLTRTLIGAPEADLTGNRFNDGKAGPGGRIWAGTMSMKETENAGSFYRLDPDLSIAKVFPDVTISNGLTWSADEKTLYYIDTPTMRVDAFDLDQATGLVTNRRTVIQIPDGIGYPDGMTIDAEGKLWIAMWTGWGVTRWDPTTGELIGKVAAPAAKVTACCFAGKDLDKLVITTASRDLTEDELKKQPHAGSIFIAEPGVRGIPSHVFQG